MEAEETLGIAVNVTVDPAVPALADVATEMDTLAGFAVR
jgi:hypothetical protein